MDNNMFLLPDPATSPTNCQNEVLNEVLKLLPPGYKFLPNDVDLIEYLKDKIAGEFIMHGLIHEVDIYNYDPNKLNDKYEYKYEGEQIMYFFTPRNRKYPNGSRPDRSAGGVGFWKATGRDNPIRINNTIIGFKKTLVFYDGIPKKATKTNWIMQEFTCNGMHVESSSLTPPSKLDGWVLCKIYKNKRQMDNENTKEVNKRHKGGIEDTGEVADSINLHDDMPNQHSQVSSLDGEATKELNEHQSEIEHSTIEATISMENVTTLHRMPNQHSQDGQFLLMKSNEETISIMEEQYMLNQHSQDGQYLQTMVSYSPSIFDSNSFLPPPSSPMTSSDDGWFNLCDCIDFYH